MKGALDSEEFFDRRRRLMRKMKRNSLAIIAAAPSCIRNRDVEYPFRQESSFHYLTGFPEPSAIAVFAPFSKEAPYRLFVEPFDAEKAQWTGRQEGLEGAVERYGADLAYPLETFQKELDELLALSDRVYFTFGQDAQLDEMILEGVRKLRGESRSGRCPPRTLSDLAPLIHEQRLIKSKREIELMREAARVSAEGHRHAMKVTRPGRLESDIEAEIQYSFARSGLRSLAYPSIVAGGSNACTLHYTDNDQVLKDGDLLLIDAGAECGLYAADITRTFPINGRFSKAQKALYEIVLKAQKAAIDAVRPGASFNDPHDAAVLELTRGLISLGLLQGKPKTLIRSQAYRHFYMHRTGHWLGLDVHDVGDYKVNSSWRKLEPGMVVTVEPGLYIAPGTKEIDPMFCGIGIRIEDDVLVTEDGHEVLTEGVPKEIEAIECLMAPCQ